MRGWCSLPGDVRFWKKLKNQQIRGVTSPSSCLHIRNILLIIRSKKTMQLTSNSTIIIFCAVLLLILPQPSHQYTYSCNSSVSCGCSSIPASITRIVGGESAGTSTWGWAVSISINRNTLCGGAVLSSSWIVTAAHCMAGVSPSQVTVFAGSNTRFSGQSRIASNVIVHPGYDSNTKVNDIALIQLSSPLSMTSSVSSICMPSVSSSTLAAGEWPPAGLSVC